MTKSELVKAVSDKTGVTLKVAELALDTVTESLVSALKGEDHEARLPGFGSFRVKTSPAGKYWNPKAKAHQDRGARSRVAFKVSAGLKRDLNTAPEKA